MSRQLANTTAIVTGASSGIGRAIAGAALFLASEESSYVTGHNLVVDGGYTAR